MAYDENTAERVRKLLCGWGDVVEKKMMGGLSFMVKGNMCCSVSGRGGILIRVGPEALDRISGEPHVRPMEMGGKTMAGFVRIDPEGYRTNAALRKWLQRGLDFAATLPEKKSPARPKRPVPSRTGRVPG
jgi:TfoX/Sxy family transcriptional regulator of competence genes